MRTKYYAYDRWVSLFIVTCETLITGGLFYLLFLTMEDTPWHKILQARKHSVNHVFSSPTSIINFTSKKPSYDDTRRSGRDNELLQRAQNDL